MKFKEPENRLQFFSLHPKLRKIVSSIDWDCISEYNFEMTITSMMRAGDTGVHGDGRGCDIRSWDFTPKQLNDVVNKYNNDFPYGDGKHPTCLVHDSGTGTHLHLQVIRDGKS